MKIKKVENKQVFKFEEVEIRKPTVADSINSEKITGTTEGIAFVAGLIASCCTFDGQKAVYEQIRRMETDDFLELSNELDVGALPVQQES